MSKECTKCHNIKELEEYSLTVNGNKRGDCKTCEAIYNKAYYLINKETMLNNQKFRRARAKKLTLNNKKNERLL